MNLPYLLPDESFEETYYSVIRPYLDQYEKDLPVQGVDGAFIHALIYDLPGSSHVICISHGFCEYIQKYSELIYIFLKAGYSVAICEHRGHGQSRRLLDNLSKVHIHTYDTYISDYHAFVLAVKKTLPAKQYFLIGHSMGGCIAARYIETYPDDFKAAVLSSPMLDIDSGGLPKWACLLFGRFMTLIGHGTDYLGDQNQNCGDKPETYENSCCLNKGRFDLWIKLRDENEYFRTSAGTIEWMAASLEAAPKAVKNAVNIRVPVLLIQAEKDNLVLPGGQDRFVSLCPCAGKVVIPGAKHESFNGTSDMRREFFNAVLTFYAKNN